MIHFDIPKLKEEAEEIEKTTNSPEFWEDVNNTSVVLKKLKSLKTKIELYEGLQKEIENIKEMTELLTEEPDEELAKEVIRTTKKIEKDINQLEIETLLSEKYDKSNAIITLHPGAGGTESQDWAEMLYRMYSKWANSHGFNLKELDYLEGDEAGIKSVTALIEGENAYGYLKCESGVHRLVRISPFDANSRRHTSFASLEVLPEISEDIEININPEDLRVDTYRASGAGGQHVNKTESAVRITHIPTNTVVSCQSERSQIQNRETAMKMLKSKLLDLKAKEHKEKIEDLKGSTRDIAWGSQIRSYVFHPYSMVKDHRTNYEVGNTDAVMNGNIDDFIKACLISKKYM